MFISGEFNRGRNSLQDEFRRPKSVVVPETIDAGRQLITQNRHVTYREIETTLGISGTSIHSILNVHLTNCKSHKKRLVSIGRKKCCKNTIAVFRNTSIVTGDESWIYAYEPESKRQSTVWVFQDESNPTKVTRSQSTFMQMIACFYGKTGLWAIVPLEQR